MGTQNLWVHKICDDTKFQVSGRGYQNICVLCISCEQKNICAFSIYAFCHICKNIQCELGFSVDFDSDLIWTSTNDLLIGYQAIQPNEVIHHEMFSSWPMFALLLLFRVTDPACFVIRNTRVI